MVYKLCSASFFSFFFYFVSTICIHVSISGFPFAILRRRRTSASAPTAVTTAISFVPFATALIVVLIVIPVVVLLVAPRLLRRLIAALVFAVRVQVHTVLMKAFERKRIKPPLVSPHTPATIDGPSRTDAPVFDVWVAQEWMRLSVFLCCTSVECRGNVFRIFGQGGIFLAQDGLDICQRSSAIASDVYHNVAASGGSTGFDRSGTKG
mmetsp:Transcript_17911/g.36918  ORF Transcript_17911/g.36918 Transcript_17911/m.36918 type:complete len:208 (+) Transcript_17911:204-827(+)